MIDLRQYQQDAFQGLHDGIAAGYRRQILCAGTGSGKTRIAAAMLQNAYDLGKKAAFIADRRTLVDQTSQRLYELGLPHGIAMAGDTQRRWEPIQICSAQTLEKRGWWPDLDFLIVDEAHAQRDDTIAFMLGTDIVTVGLTATPFTKGLGLVYENVINSSSTNQLIREGWLSPLKVFLPPKSQINMQGKKLRAGEWIANDVAERAGAIFGDIPTEWQRHTNREFGGPVKTIVFVPTIKYAEELAAEFNRAGFRFETVSYKDGNGEQRRNRIKALEEGKVDGLISVECLVKGLDIPDIKCVVMARKFENSLASHIQAIGRGMRTAPGKDYCLLIDHTMNFYRFFGKTMHFWEHGCDELDVTNRNPKIEQAPKEHQPSMCKACGFLMPVGMSPDNCPACGISRRKMATPTVVSSQLVELNQQASLASLGMQMLTGKSRKTVSERQAERPKNADPWKDICSLANDKKKGESEKAKYNWALGAYKSITGKFPPYGAKFDPQGRMTLPHGATL